MKSMKSRRTSRSSHGAGKRKQRRHALSFTASSSPSSTRVLEESSDEEYSDKSVQDDHSVPKKPILKTCNSPPSSRRNSDTKKVHFSEYNQILNTEDPCIEEWVLMNSQEVC